MRFVIFSGTTEGRELSVRLAAAGAEVVVCVASDYGSEEQGSCDGIITRTGPLSPEEKQRLLRTAALCVDATHPYATHVTASVMEACERAGVPYLRLSRAASDTEGVRCFDSAGEAAGWLAGREGNILLTTGAKELAAFAGLDPERIYPRILPSHQSLSACEEQGIPHRNIIAMQGPFSTEMNIATIRQYEIRYLVTKDGGAPGGYPEKASAARETGAELIVLNRPGDDAGPDFDTVYHQCITLLQSGDAK
ncbi:MAG: precorrin-6A reductase [Oscillospiraceae bacterium]|nr:precorrin-6A reductase [Oscillospiraceae bacterium]